jgi:hypothetical protein
VCRDPAFYEHLKKSDKDLLAFDAEAAADDAEADAEAVLDAAAPKTKKDKAAKPEKKTRGQKEKERAAKGIDHATLKALSKHIIERKSVTALRRMVSDVARDDERDEVDVAGTYVSEWVVVVCSWRCTVRRVTSAMRT